MKNNIKENNKKQILKKVKISHKDVKKMVFASIFTAIGVVLMLLEFPIPIPGWPPFLRMDFSSLVLLLSLFVIGFEFTIIVCVLKNWLKFLLDPGVGMWQGHLLDMILEISVLLVFLIIYMIFTKVINNKHKYKQIFALATASILSIIISAIVAVFANYWFIFKLYGLNPDSIGLKGIFLSYGTFTMFKFLLVFLLFALIVFSMKKFFMLHPQYLISDRTNNANVINQNLVLYNFLKFKYKNKN